MGKKKVVEASIFPSYKPAEVKEINVIIERKVHLEYLALMMLDALNKTFPLKVLVEKGIRAGICDESSLREFFDMPPETMLEEDDEVGCCSAEGHTVESLLKEWHETTDNMIKAVAKR